jgi:hypothetical protein
VGYKTDAGSLIMVWEPLVVMFRKLIITLVGSLLPDAHLQIMIAIMILSASLALQAFMQPYESQLLNVLDVLSILALITTQVLSITYRYLDEMDTDSPLELERTTIEASMTVALFALNIGMIMLLLIAYMIRYLYEQAYRESNRAKKIGGGTGESSLEVELVDASLGPLASDERMSELMTGLNPMVTIHDLQIEDVLMEHDNENEEPAGDDFKEFVTREKENPLLSPAKTLPDLLGDSITRDHHPLPMMEGHSNPLHAQGDSARTRRMDEPRLPMHGEEMFARTTPANVDEVYDVDTEGWYYSDINDENIQHGPFSLPNHLLHWFNDGHFDADFLIHHDSGQKIALKEALRRAGLLGTNAKI